MGKVVKIKRNHKIYSLYLTERKNKGKNNKEQVREIENTLSRSWSKPKIEINIKYKWNEQSN